MGKQEPRKDFGKIIILNGVPRAGKSGIVEVIQNTFEGFWVNLGVDNYMKTIPAAFQPGIGLRPGGERPDMEPMIRRLYLALYESIRVHSLAGIDVAADFGHHDFYSEKMNILSDCAKIIEDLPVLFVGVRCPIEVVMKRRIETWNSDYEPDGTVPLPVQRWQEFVHKPGIYDVEVNTSENSPEECAEIIHRRMEDGTSWTAIKQLAVYKLS